MSTQSLWFEAALLPAGWWDRVRIDVRDGRIASIETDVAPAAGIERHRVVLPGIPNLHSHAFQRAMAGLTEARKSDASRESRDDFWSWREVMYRFVDRIGPEDLQAIAALAYTEMLEAGFTRVGEFHYLHHDTHGSVYANPAEMCERLIAAADATGIALTLLPVLYCHSGFGGSEALDTQRRFVLDFDEFTRLVESARRAIIPLPDAVVGVAPHSLRAVSPALLQQVEQLAGLAPLHIHVAEQLAEVRDCVAWSGQRPVEWLLNNTHIDARWCLVHATHLVDSEVKGLAQSGAIAGLCPITESNLGDGLFRAHDYLQHGGLLGIGSDSNVLISATEELRTLEYGQRIVHHSRNVLASAATPSTGRRLIDTAVRGGSQALGGRTSGIAVGSPADFFSLNTAHTSLLGRRHNELLDSWIFATTGNAVDCVWRAGQTARYARRPHPTRRDRCELPAHPGAADSVSAKPLHDRIRADIERRILAGKWSVGYRIPYEHELMRQYDCSRMTVNRALSALANAGLIERRRRAGSFVAMPRIHSAVLTIADIQAEIEARGERYGYQLLSSERLTARQQKPPALELRGARSMLVLQCRHLANGRTFALEHRAINLTAVPEAAKVDFANLPPGTWLLHHVPWTEAEHRISARNAEAGVARLLGIDIGGACLSLERLTWRGTERITHVRQLFPAPIYDLVARFGPRNRILSDLYSDPASPPHARSEFEDR